MNKKLKNGYTMYDWIMRQKGFPAFCMRTLCGENKIVTEEIEFLKNKDCIIGLVIRDLSEETVSGSNGSEDAMRAVDSAKKLGVPQNSNIALYAEIKPEWSINHNWMTSFAQKIYENGYVPGFIGNTDSSKNFNFDRHCSHFVQETKDNDHFGAMFMATEPKIDTVPQEWSPFCPSALEHSNISLWACGTTTFDFYQVEDVYAKDNNVLKSMWKKGE